MSQCPDNVIEPVIDNIVEPVVNNIVEPAMRVLKIVPLKKIQKKIVGPVSTPLELQMAQQLTEQTRQLEEMNQIMKPLLEIAEKVKKDAEEKAKKEHEDWLAEIAKKEAEEKEAAEEKAKNEAEKLRKAEHLRKNREFKQSLILDSFEKLSANGFQRTLGVYGYVKGAELSMDVIKEIGGEKHLWMRSGCHLSHYQGKCVPYNGDIKSNPCNQDRLIPMYSLIYGEEPALYK